MKYLPAHLTHERLVSLITQKLGVEKLDIEP